MLTLKENRYYRVKRDWNEIKREKLYSNFAPHLLQKA